MPKTLFNAELHEISAYKHFQRPWGRQAESFMDYVAYWTELFPAAFAPIRFTERGPRLFLDDMAKNTSLAPAIKHSVTTLLANHAMLSISGEPASSTFTYTPIGIAAVRNHLLRDSTNSYISCYAKVHYGDINVFITYILEEPVSNFDIRRFRGKPIFDTAEQKEAYRLFLEEDIIITSKLKGIIAQASDPMPNDFNKEDYQGRLFDILQSYVIPLIVGKYFSFETAVSLNSYFIDSDLHEVRRIIKDKINGVIIHRKIPAKHIKNADELYAAFQYHVDFSIQKAIEQEQKFVDTGYILATRNIFSDNQKEYQKLVGELQDKAPPGEMEELPQQDITAYLSPPGDTLIKKHEYVKENQQSMKDLENKTRATAERNENTLAKLRALVEANKPAPTIPVEQPQNNTENKKSSKNKHTKAKIQPEQNNNNKKNNDEDAITAAIANNRALILHQAPRVNGNAHDKQLAEYFRLNAENAKVLNDLYHSKVTSDAFRETISSTVYQTYNTIREIYGSDKAENIFSIAFKNSQFFRNKTLKLQKRVEVGKIIEDIARVQRKYSFTYDFNLKKNTHEKIVYAIEMFLDYSRTPDDRIVQICTAIFYAIREDFTDEECATALRILIERPQHFPIKEAITGSVDVWVAMAINSAHALQAAGNRSLIYNNLLNKFSYLFRESENHSIRLPSEYASYGSHDYLALCTLNTTLASILDTSRGNAAHLMAFQFAFHYISNMANKSELYKLYYEDLLRIFDENAGGIGDFPTALKNLISAVFEMRFVTYSCAEDSDSYTKIPDRLDLESAVKSIIITGIMITQSEQHMRELIDFFLYTCHRSKFEKLFDESFQWPSPTSFDKVPVYGKVIDLLKKEMTTDGYEFWKRYENTFPAESKPLDNLSYHIQHVIDLHTCLTLVEKHHQNQERLDMLQYNLMRPNMKDAFETLNEMKLKYKQGSANYNLIGDWIKKYKATADFVEIFNHTNKSTDKVVFSSQSVTSNAASGNSALTKFQCK